MKILFLTLSSIDSIHQAGLYPDLLRVFVRDGDSIYIVSPSERRFGQPTRLIREDGCSILRVRIGNITKTNPVEKGITTLRIEEQFLRAVLRHFRDVRFDLVLYSTPPITFANVIKAIKKRDDAKSYLLLKDIFPQNAVDLGMLSTRGIKAPLYWYFRHKERQLYQVSDRIGCMSPANVCYLQRQNPEVADRAEVCPNSIELRKDMDGIGVDKNVRIEVRAKYGIPEDKTVFAYGGNLGRPQGIPFIIECLKACAKHPKAFFLVVGDGTEFGRLQTFLEQEKPTNILLLWQLTKPDYDCLLASVDVGLIFLDHQFTIPNFPSRLLSYMQTGLPVLACTDPNTDVGEIITAGGFGWWCESNNAAGFAVLVEEICRISDADRKFYGAVAQRYLADHYDVNVVSLNIRRFMDE